MYHVMLLVFPALRHDRVFPKVKKRVSRERNINTKLKRGKKEKEQKIKILGFVAFRFVDLAKRCRFRGIDSRASVAGSVYCSDS